MSKYRYSLLLAKRELNYVIKESLVNTFHVVNTNSRWTDFKLTTNLNGYCKKTFKWGIIGTSLAQKKKKNKQIKQQKIQEMRPYLMFDC